ncbi:MAG: hypothetical protein EOO95_16675, partial [Pedobacter sp.]
MRDIKLPLRETYFSKLTALNLDVYENGAVPSGALTPYVIISSVDAKEESNKSDFGHKAAILLDIVTKFPKNQTGGGKERDLIAGQILAVINSKAPFIINENLQSVNLKITSDQTLEGTADTDRVFRRLIR